MPFLIKQIRNIFKAGGISAIVLRRDNNNPICFLYPAGKVKYFRRGVRLIFQPLLKKGKIIDMKIQDLSCCLMICFQKIFKE
jgi:hypothetical protein